MLALYRAEVLCGEVADEGGKEPGPAAGAGAQRAVGRRLPIRPARPPDVCMYDDAIFWRVGRLRTLLL